jgi:hypothetical protein
LIWRLTRKLRKYRKCNIIITSSPFYYYYYYRNDPAAHVHDIWEYQQTVELVKNFVNEHPNTVLVSTSDHETGGFTAGRQVGEAYPE